MRPADNINEMIKKLKVKASTDLDKRVHEAIFITLAESDETKSTLTQPNIGRTIMKSPITKIVAAAAIVIAFFAGLYFWTSTSSGIALADVLTRIEQVSAYMYKMHWTETNQQTTSEVASTVWVSQDNGIKMIQTRVDPNSGESRNDEVYLLPQENTMLLVMHQEKNIYRIKWEDAEEDYYKEKYNDPHTIIKEILNCSHTSLGQSVIDRKAVEGFQTTDPAYKGGFFGRSDLIVGGLEKVDVKLWVDVDTFLPIRFEEDIITKAGLHTHEVSYDFRWNVVVNDDDFKPDITEDYNSPMGDWNIPATNEENAIKGLRLFANYAGSYPVNIDPGNLDIDAFRKETKKYLEASHVSDEELTEEEKTQQNSELFLMGMPIAFYNDLVTENKDPAYYGKTVTPEDADKVLMRWKITDNECRIIFGDLRTKTVSADELIELENP
jgi:outer membrane lipoprotein-sorting protein